MDICISFRIPAHRGSITSKGLGGELGPLPRKEKQNRVSYRGKEQVKQEGSVDMGLGGQGTGENTGKDS